MSGQRLLYTAPLLCRHPPVCKEPIVLKRETDESIRLISSHEYRAVCWNSQGMLKHMRELRQLWEAEWMEKGEEGEGSESFKKVFFLKTEWRQNGVVTRRKCHVWCSWTNEDISRLGERTTRRILDLYILPDFRHKL